MCTAFGGEQRDRSGADTGRERLCAHLLERLEADDALNVVGVAINEQNESALAVTVE